jgi:hypothetical protein
VVLKPKGEWPAVSDLALDWFLCSSPDGFWPLLAMFRFQLLASAFSFGGRGFGLYLVNYASQTETAN